jgi:hypothetical protein
MLNDIVEGIYSCDNYSLKISFQCHYNNNISKTLIWKFTIFWAVHVFILFVDNHLYIDLFSMPLQQYFENTDFDYHGLVFWSVHVFILFVDKHLDLRNCCRYLHKFNRLEKQGLLRRSVLLNCSYSCATIIFLKIKSA